MPPRYRRAARKTLGLAPASGLMADPRGSEPPEGLLLAASRTANCGWHTRGVSQSPDPRGPDEPCVLLKLGEIVLKGRNRQQFERILQGNIRAAVRDTRRAGHTCASGKGSSCSASPTASSAASPAGAQAAGPDRGAGAGRARHRPGLPAAPGGQDARGGHRRRGGADQGPRRARSRSGPGAGTSASPLTSRTAERAGRPGDRRGARTRRQPVPARHRGVHRGGPATRCSCSPRESPPWAGCRWG